MIKNLFKKRGTNTEKEYRISLGCNDPDAHRQIYDIDYIKFETINIMKKYFSGWTIFDAEGYWEGEIKHTLVIEIACVTYENVTNCAKELREKFNQQCVKVDARDVSTTWIDINF